MGTFLFIMIVTSGMEIYGYAFIDVVLMGCFLFLINIKKDHLKIRINWILIFCIYMIFQVIRGMYVLDDLRMIYWVFFFIVIYFSHLYLVDLYKKAKIDYQFVKKIFDYSFVYFIIYGSLALFIRNPDDYQGIYWVGSSGAFIVLIPFLSSHFILFQDSGYSARELKLPTLLLYLIITIIHYSRIGMYLLFLYILYLVYKVSFFNIRKLVLMLTCVGLTLFVWDTTRQVYFTGSGVSGTGTAEIIQLTGVMDEGVSSLEETSNDVSRFLMVLSTYDKLISSPKEFLFGSGWYTSRYMLKPYEAENLNLYGFQGDHITSDKPMQVTGFAAIISDTGFVGLLFILYFFYKSSRQIFQSKSPGRIILIVLLSSNWIFFLVGNTFISILAFLLLFPNGLLVSLARANISRPQLIKKVKNYD